MEDSKIDFSWFYFIGRNKLGLTFKEIGRLTLRKFNQLYQIYKDTFDLEMMLKNKKITYGELRRKSLEAEEWFS